MGCCSPNCVLNYHLVTAVLGILAGLSSFFVFSFHFHNYNAGIWGLVAFIMSLGNLHIHLLQKKNKLSEYHSERSLSLVGILAFLAGLGATIAMITYIVLSVKEGTHMTPDSLYMGATQSFLALKYGFSLAYCSWRYSRNLTSGYGLVE